MDESTRELEKRLKELAERAFRESHYIFTDFLNSSQLSVYYEMKDRELSFIQSTVFVPYVGKTFPDIILH